jgi:hypothetical protein
MQILFPKLILAIKKPPVEHSDGPVPYPDQVYYNSTGVVNTSVTKVGGFGDGVLCNLKSLLLLLLALDEAEDVHGFGSNGY